ncbi:MAG: ribulose-phosphate 3-epimerase [Oscillospiraceae bacterium]|nr:ribulose-phosphate 3-epimerase [Oscillospiraceae bacterium]
MKTLVSASILSADLMNLSGECQKLKKSGVDMLHFDVMDGHFVNNISFGVPVLESLSRSTDIFMDVHLMISDPLRYTDVFAQAGSDLITFHAESDSNTAETINAIKKHGIMAGISVKPSTPAESVFEYISMVDIVLVMTVEPGFGGQGFIAGMIPKIRTLRQYIDSHNLKTRIQVDGGINEKTAPLVREAGADILVSGSYLFRSPSMKDAVDSLK